MFQFPALASIIRMDGIPSEYRVVPADQRSFAPTRGLSQLITSFIASESQGIRHAPLLTFLSYRHSSRYILSAFNFYFHFVHHVIDRRE